MSKSFKIRYTKSNKNNVKRIVLLSISLLLIMSTYLGYSIYREKKTNTLSLSINKPTFTVTLNNQSATTSGTATIYEKYGTGYYLNSNNTNRMTSSANPITKPTKNNYEFKGYYTSTNGSGTKYIDENGYLTSSASNTKFTNNTGSLYAYWERIYTITYDANGGSVNPSSQSGTAGSSITMPTPTLTGSDFAGWYTSASGGTQVTYTSIPSEDVTVYAHWTVTSGYIYYSNQPSTTGTKTHWQSSLGSGLTVTDTNRVYWIGTDGYIYYSNQPSTTGTKTHWQASTSSGFTVTDTNRVYWIK